jgi:hypothetical protein
MAKALEMWVERLGGLLSNSFFGILHCVQDDSRNMQLQVQPQLPPRSRV